MSINALPKRKFSKHVANLVPKTKAHKGLSKGSSMPMAQGGVDVGSINKLNSQKDSGSLMVMHGKLTKGVGSITHANIKVSQQAMAKKKKPSLPKSYSSAARALRHNS